MEELPESALGGLASGGERLNLRRASAAAVLNAHYSCDEKDENGDPCSAV